MVGFVLDVHIFNTTLPCKLQLQSLALSWRTSSEAAHNHRHLDGDGDSKSINRRLGTLQHYPKW